jgi:hypothetical protein
VVSVERTLVQVEAQRFSAYFSDLLCERPFKFPRHPIRSFGIGIRTAMSDINIKSVTVPLELPYSPKDLLADVEISVSGYKKKAAIKVQ